MKEYDKVELIVEKSKYTNKGLHKGMVGWICDPKKINGQRLVCFDTLDDLPEYPIVSIEEDDLKIIWVSPD